jgi:hypothetical protein
MAPLPSPGDSDRAVTLHALSAVAALREAHRQPTPGPPGLVQGRTVLFRGPCSAALDCLSRGDPARPAAQNAALLLGAACLNLGLVPPLFVPRSVPRVRLSAATPDIDWDCSTPELRVFLADLAARFGATISLDVFASPSSALTHWFFAEDPNARAEGVDASAQPDSGWGSSTCALCSARHQEFIALTPPFPVTARALRKAQCDEACGVSAVPYQVTAPWWPLASNASTTTSVLHSADTGVIPPESLRPCLYKLP